MTRLASSSRSRASGDQPARNVSRTVRRGLSRFVSIRAIDCQVPSVMFPSTTGTTRRWRREQGQDVIGAVSGAAVDVAPARVAWQETIQRGEKIGIGPGAELDDDQACGGVRNEDGQQPVISRDVTQERGAGIGQIAEARSRARLDDELACVHDAG